MQHTRHTALGDDHIVDGMAQEAFFPVRFGKAREQQPMFNAVIAIKQLLQLRFQFAELNISHKAQCADIDTTDWHGHGTIAAADTQKGTITANGQSNIGCFLFNIRHA